MIGRAINLILSGVVPTKLLLAFGAAQIALMPLLYLPESDSDILGLLIFAAMLLLLIVCFALVWMITRALADVHKDEVGATWPWLGWTAVSALPALAFYLAIDDGFQAQEYWWVYSVIFSVLIAIMVPFAVHSTGRAINRNGPPLQKILSHCAPIYLSCALAVFFPELLGSLFDDGVAADIFDGSHGGLAILANGIILGLVYTATMLLTLAISVIIYRDAEAKSQQEAN